MSIDGEWLEGSLVTFYEIEGDSFEEDLEMAIETLEDEISAETGRETGLVTFSVSTNWGSLSAQISQRILDLVNEFNLEKRQSQAGEERIFVQERLTEKKVELREAEDQLLEFLQQNRAWRASNELTFIHDRLQREVIMRQEVYTTLAQAFEQASIDEVRDTPVITVMEKPKVPVFPDSRHLVVKGLLTMIVGTLMGIFGAFGAEFLRRGRERDKEEYALYTRLRRESLKDLVRPWRLFRRSS
ncbi:hypothetical protein ACFL3H_05745 [Gemmatimonadota bacterium]